MNIEYTKRLNKIEEHIDKLLPKFVDSAWLSSCAGQVNHAVPFKHYDIINEPARDLIQRGGKRWRPLLMLLTAEMYGANDDILCLAPLVEFPHNGSLIVDDIEDGSDMRRGKPAVHMIYGVDLSINAGNWLYYLPTVLIDQSPYDEKRKLSFYQVYAENMRRLHLGQGLDIQWHRDKAFFPDEEAYFQMCRFKTGALSRMSAELGVLAAGMSLEEAEAYSMLCESLGVGFQIADDIINLTIGNPGKKRGDDIVEGKKSLPVLLCAKQSKQNRQKLTQFFHTQSIEEAISLIHSSGAIDEARQKAINLIDESLIEMKVRCPNNEIQNLIIELFQRFLHKAL